MGRSIGLIPSVFHVTQVFHVGRRVEKGAMGRWFFRRFGLNASDWERVGIKHALSRFKGLRSWLAGPSRSHLSSQKRTCPYVSNCICVCGLISPLLSIRPKGSSWRCWCLKGCVPDIWSYESASALLIIGWYTCSHDSRIQQSS